MIFIFNYLWIDMCVGIKMRVWCSFVNDLIFVINVDLNSGFDDNVVELDVVLEWRFLKWWCVER